MEKGMVMALGFFDGVHLGHLQLIRKAVEIAEAKDLIPSVLTFENHPFTKIFPEKVPLLLTDNAEKIALINAAGIQNVFLEPFSEELMRLSPEKFIDDFLLKKYPVRHLVVGYDYSFGYKGKGNVKDLEKLGVTRGFDVTVIPPYLINGRKVCSTLIRNSILNGKVEAVPALLGRDYTVSGEVIHGKHLGRQFDIPTANLLVDQRLALPDNGVYYSKVIIDGQLYDGLTNLGNNPTFKDHPFSVETYIYDFDDDLYGRNISVSFLKKQREEMKFQSVDLLVEQIRKDIEHIDRMRKERAEAGR